MRLHYLSVILFSLLALTACNLPEPEPTPTVTFTETLDEFPNPERGFYVQVNYDGNDLTKVTNLKTILSQRDADDCFTLYLHEYHLEKYVNGPIEQAFLDRLDTNMQVLRQGGAKAIIRFAYSNGFDAKDHPWDATPEIVSQHIDQLAPFFRKNADVIATVQAGFIGSWGEWYYTDNFVSNPKTSEQFQLRREMLFHLLDVVPADRQVAVRTPDYKVKILNITYADTLLPSEAYTNTYKARIAAHNDAFNSTSNDMGTYDGAASRTYWAADSKYTWMGGESDNYVAALAAGPKAIERLTISHFDYLNRNYLQKVLNTWISTGYMPEIRRRLGYRFVMDKAWFETNPQPGSEFSVKLALHNVGFASPKNARAVELVVSNGTDTYVFPQPSIDPRTWMPGATYKETMTGVLPAEMSGAYNVYLNLPDPYASLHDNPMFSIRMANENVWDGEHGYNLIGTITL